MGLLDSVQTMKIKKMTYRVIEGGKQIDIPRIKPDKFVAEIWVSRNWVDLTENKKRGSPVNYFKELKYDYRKSAVMYSLMRQGLSDHEIQLMLGISDPEMRVCYEHLRKTTRTHPKYSPHDKIDFSVVLEIERLEHAIAKLYIEQENKKAADVQMMLVQFLQNCGLYELKMPVPQKTDDGLRSPENMFPELRGSVVVTKK